MPMVALTLRARLWVATAALVAATSACIPSGPPPTEAPTWTRGAPAAPQSEREVAAPLPTGARPSATVSPPPTQPALDCPSYDDGPDLAYVAIDGHRFASVCTGMTFEQASAALPGVVEVRPQCTWVATLVEAAPLYIEAVSTRDNPTGPIQFFRLAYIADPATAPPHEVPGTAEGVSIGSARSDVAAAYPAAFEAAHDDPLRGTRQQLVVQDTPGHWYVFDLVDDVVAEITWGKGIEAGVPIEFCPLDARR
jgi:hypothetical protein